LHFISTSSPTAHDSLEGYAGVTETYLHLLEQHPSDKELNQKARKALKGLLNCAKLFPIAMPRYLCYQGWYAWIRGDKNKAATSWKKGLGLATQLEMRYEEARLSFEIGWHTSSSKELKDALERFEALNTDYEIQAVTKLLK
jgi:hypothetical protein